MIDRGHDLALRRQAALLKLSRSSVYDEPRPVSLADLALLRRIDAPHMDYPFAGSRMPRDLLRGEGVVIGRERVARMMRRMGIAALYRRPNTSKPAPGHKIYPYLLRGVAVERPNQVWAMDITYIPMARGFVNLAAVVDWFSRRVLAWRLSITMEVEFCLAAVEEALAKHGRPEIFNTDQGSHTNGRNPRPLVLACSCPHAPGGRIRGLGSPHWRRAAFAASARHGARRKSQEIRALVSVHLRGVHRPAAGERDRDQHGLSAEGDQGGAWRDTVFGERLWRSVKYEEVYPRAYDSVAEARASLGRYLAFYNRRRPHSSLDARTPERAYFEGLPQRAA